jgi:hypothetical protein
LEIEQAASASRTRMQRTADACDEYAERRDAARPAPDCEVDGLEIGWRVSARRSKAVAVDGMDVGAAIEEQLDDAWRAADHGTMQRRPAGAIAGADECRVDIEQRAHTSNVATLGSYVHRMIGAGL